MKLRHKIIIITSMIWLLFLAVSFLLANVLLSKESVLYPNHIHYFMLSIIITTIVFTVATFMMLRSVVIKRLELLAVKINNIHHAHTTKRQKTYNDNDELTSVTTEINHMLDIINKSSLQTEERVLERTKELENLNVKLIQEIQKQKSKQRELIANKERLVRLAHYDSLTTLPNRIFFNEILNKAIHHSNKNNRRFAILFVDFDNFRTINDAFGHSTGDLLLKQMSSRFAKILNASDVLARLSSDEFIMLLSNIGESNYPDEIAKKIFEICSHSVTVDTHEFYISVSIGITIFPDDGHSLEDLQKNADIAMYHAKRSGGGIHLYFTQDMNVAAEESAKLEDSLRRAIKNKEFVLYFQPQLSLKDGSIKRVEALIRWIDPVLGLVNPNKFIPFAEETGLIMPIGEWTIHEACRLNKIWQDAGYDPVTIAVNLSPKQFRHQDIVGIVKDALKESSLDAKYLEIEVTETTVMENVEVAINKLNSLHEMGVCITIDDFGTGYTSISYLKKFPVSILKIDQTFIKGIPTNQNDVAITSAFIGLGHNLGLEVVAEGVETAEQLQFLTEHQCDLAQGYFLSRPVPEQKIVVQFTKNGVSQDSIIQID